MIKQKGREEAFCGSMTKQKGGEEAFCGVILMHTDFFQYSPKGPGRAAMVITHKIEQGHIFAHILEQRFS